MTWLKQNTATTIKMGPFLDSADLSAETGLSIAQADIRLTKNGGDYAQSNNSAGATADENGDYDIPLDTTDTNTIGRLKVMISKSGVIPVWLEFEVLPPEVYEYLTSASANMGIVIAAIKTQTDKFAFTGSDVKATLDGETVVVGTNNDKSGYALDSNYDAAKTAASQSSVNTLNSNIDTIDSIVDAIKIQTDKLHFNLDNDVLATLNNETVTVGSNLDKSGYSLGTTPPTAAEIRIEMDGNSVKMASIVAKTNTLDWTDIEFLIDYIGGRRKIFQNQMILYKSDNITEVARFDLKDFQGLPTMENVFERVRV